MADEWIKREAERIRESDERRREQDRLQLHRADVLKVKAPIFFAEAAEATRKAVQVFNAEIAEGRPERQLQIDVQERSIGVGGLGSYLTATLENPSTGVITCMTESGQGSRTPNLERTVLSLDIDGQGNVSIRGDSERGPELVAQVLVRPFLRHIDGKTT